MKLLKIALVSCICFCCVSASYAQFGELKKALGSIAGMAENDSTQLAESVNWKPLSKLLPESIDGMESSDLDGGTFKSASPTNPTEQYSYSSVSKTYKQDKKKIKITIMDSGYNQLLLAPFMMTYEYDGPKGYMKSTTVNGHNAKEMVDLKGDDVKQSQLMVAVKDRVLVMFEGSGGVTMDDLKKQSDKIDYGTIEKLIGETEKNLEKSLESKK